MITLTREEAQQVLDTIGKVFDHNDWQSYETTVDLLRARLSAPEPEPVAWNIKHNRPPLSSDNPHEVVAVIKREWQGLTDEEMSAAMDYWSDPVRSAYGGAHSADGEYVGMIDTWQYIEAKLKEKNT